MHLISRHGTDQLETAVRRHHPQLWHGSVTHDR
jgi:hypothetical protein